MKMSNEDLVYSARDTISSLELALSEIEGINEYKEEYDTISDVIDDLNSKLAEYEEEYNKELQAELDYQDMEYMRSVI